MHVKFIYLIYFVAAAIAILDVQDMDAEKILRKSMKIAGDFCVYTNHNLVVESLPPAVDAKPASSS